MTKLEKSFEKSPTAYEIFRSAFPVHENFSWSMPSVDDPEALEKIEQAPVWGNNFREDDVVTIIDSLNELSFDTLVVATKLQNLYEEADRPQFQKDADSAAGKKWSGLITYLLHIVTTNLYKKREGGYKAKPLVPGFVLTPEERSRPLEDRHGLQNNIAANIIMLGDKEFEDLKPQAQKVVALFQKGDKTGEERKEMLAEKLALEKSYFQKKFPEFFTDDSEDRPEASPELFQEMIDQLPILQEMLREAEIEFFVLKVKAGADPDKIKELQKQVGRLREETLNREGLEEPEKLMSDLWRIGPVKPLGYLPIETLTTICGESVAETKKKLEKMGLKVILFQEDECHVVAGALYAYDEDALRQLLSINSALLKKNGWSTDPRTFVYQVAKAYASPESGLYELVGKAFADKRFK